MDSKFSWLHTVAPTAIAFLPAASLGAPYQGNAFVGDINNGRVYRFRLNPASNGFLFSDPDLADLVADSDAELDEGCGHPRVGSECLHASQPRCRAATMLESRR